MSSKKKQKKLRKNRKYKRTAHLEKPVITPSETNTRFSLSKCPFCGFEKAESWFASKTWYCPKCGKTTLDPSVSESLVDPKLKKRVSRVFENNRKIKEGLAVEEEIIEIKNSNCTLSNYKQLGLCFKGRLEKYDKSYILNKSYVLTCCCGTPFLIEKSDYKKSAIYCDTCNKTHSKAFYCNHCNNIHSFDSYGRITHLEKIK